MDEPADDELTLAAEFPAATREDWLRLVQAALKGSPSESLTIKSYDGLRIEPLSARRPDATPITGCAPGAAWQVMQRVDHPDPAAANAQALDDLANGATGLSLVFAGAIGAYGYGLPPGADALARALDGVDPGAIALDLDLSIPAREAPLHLAGWMRQGGINPAKTQIRCGLDPLRSLATEGASPLAWPELAALLVKLVNELGELGFTGPLAVADGRAIHNAGGSEAQELAYVLATGVAYLRALADGGISLDDARRTIFFRLSADADLFLAMAKFRALRRLWARTEQACGLAPKPPFIAAETAWRMMTKRDPHVNMLRTTIATVAAGLGGADAITVLPFTAALGLPDGFARRMARNTQLILLEESNLAKVADPAAGSGGIEAMTEQLCVGAWALFQEIEAAGGACAALRAGLVQRKIADVRRAREAAVSTRVEALIGTSEFPNLAEPPVRVLDVAPVTAAAPTARVLTAEPLPRIRLAAPFEALRDASDRALATRGARPKIFLANLGTPSDFTARASFAKNFFEAGGIEAMTNDGLPAREALMSAFKASGATLACLCSSDIVYEREAVAAANTLTAAGAEHIYLAGRPSALEPALRAAGVETFIFAGCNALATLQAAHGILGIR